ANVAEVAEQLANDRLRPAAKGALEVAVLDQRDGRVLGATAVVSLRIDRHGQVDERLGSAEERPEPPPPWQQRRAAEEEPGQERGAERRAEDPDLRLCQLLAVERELRDQQCDGEADPCDRPAAG